MLKRKKKNSCVSMREQPFFMTALLLQTSFIWINGVALPAYMHISLKKKKNPIIPQSCLILDYV